MVALLGYPLSMKTPSDLYRLTGAVYFVLGSTVMAITVMTPGLASPERRTDLVHLLIGLPFFALFALMIAYGDRPVAALLRSLGRDSEAANRAGLWVREKLTMLLTLSALGRAFIFSANGIGWKPGISWFPFAFSIEPVPAMPRMLINALLMLIIISFLVRAAWIPCIKRWRGNSSMTD